MNIQVVGHCRFSYPHAPGMLGIKEETYDEHLAKLYAPERLAYRLLQFEHVALPALKAQTDPDFKFIILAGDDFPEPFRSQLLDLIAGTPQITAYFEPPKTPVNTLRRLSQQARTDETKVVAEFCLDDDDAVSVDFVQTVKAVFPKMRGLYRQHEKLTVSFSKGMLLSTAAGGGAECQPIYALHWMPSLANYTGVDAPSPIGNHNHKKVWQHVPTVSLPDKYMFVRGAHAFNISASGRKGPSVTGFTPIETETRHIGRLLKRRFNIDLPALRRSLRDMPAS